MRSDTRSARAHGGCGWRVCFLSIAFILSGCAFSDEGAIDYRRTANADPHVKTADKPEVQSAIRLVRKNKGNDNAEIFKEGSAISISLEQGLLVNCVEWLRSPARGFTKNCEIAIVARVVEFGNGRNDFNFGDDGVRAGRVVYYSSDIEAGQTFNLNHLPIYGPQAYHGGPLGIELYVIEIDAEDAQAQALFQALAAIGSVAYPPAAPVLKVLDRLGGALLSGTGGDDMVFRYFLTLDPSEGSSGFDSQLQAGGYAMVREQNREARTNWAELALDENSGRIYELDPDGSLKLDATGRPVEYRSNSYLTLSIDKDKSSKSVDLSQNTFGTFRDALEATDKKQAAQISASARDVIEALVERRATENYDDARGKLAEVRRAMTSERKVSRADVRRLIAHIEQGVLQKKDWDAFKNGGDPGGAFKLDGGDVLSDLHLDYLLDGLRSLTGDKADPTLLDRLTIESLSGKALGADEINKLVDAVVANEAS